MRVMPSFKLPAGSVCAYIASASRNSLGLLRADEAKFEDAERVVRQGLQMSKSGLPPGHASIAAATDTRAMRQLLIESARRRQARKRGGEGQALFVMFDEAIGLPTSQDEDVLRLDSALEELAKLNPRQRDARFV